MNLKTKIIVLATVIAISLSATGIGAQTLGESAVRELDKQDRVFIGESGLGVSEGLPEVINEIIKIFLSFLGVIFIVLLIYGGFLWMTSAGNEEKITQAKKLMVGALIGLTIILAAFMITYFVIDKILEATSGGTGLDTGV